MLCSLRYSALSKAWERVFRGFPALEMTALLVPILEKTSLGMF